MNNRYHYKVAVVFISLILSLAPLTAFAGGGGIGGLGLFLAIIAGMRLLAFSVSTAIEFVLLRLWRKRQSGQRAVLSIILVAYSIFYIPFIIWFILSNSFNWLYYQFVHAGIINAMLALTTILVIGLFLLKETYAKRFKAVLWLSSGFVLVLTALLYIGTAACSGIFIKGLSDYGVKSYITIPLILAAIMLVGAIINASISNDIKKVNILFITLLFLASMLMRIDKDAFAFWADVSLAVAWILQRRTTKKWQQQ